MIVERFFRSLKEEGVWQHAFQTFEEARRVIRDWMHWYNQERPHQALNGAYPGDLYTPSARVYQPPPEPEYPYHDRTVRVSQCGRICIG